MLYVLGFLFGKKDGKNVVWLMKKTKPHWQINLLNGIGGKFEYRETPIESMCREFREETGVETLATDWTEFCELSDMSLWRIHCFTSHKECSPKTTTEEEVGCYDMNNLPQNIIPNVPWLVSMAFHTPPTTIYQIAENTLY